MAQSPAVAWLTDWPRDAPDRHRTLQASIAWSYELLTEEDRPDLLSRVLDRAGVLAAYQSDFDRALQLTERCLAVRRDLGDQAGIAETLANLSYVLLHRGDFDRAVEASHESLAIQRVIAE